MFTVVGVPEGVQLSSPAKRLCGVLLEGVLFAVTLGIGWLAWSLVVWGHGQTPAKQLLGMVVARQGTRYTASRGTMFVREIVAKTTVAYFPSAIVIITPASGLWLAVVLAMPVLEVALVSWLLWDRDNQQPWDKAALTLVVDDPFRQLVPAPPERAGAHAPPRFAREVPLSRVAINRGVQYLTARKYEAGLRLIEQGVVDARRHGDLPAVERAIKVVTQIRPRLPAGQHYLADQIVRTARRPLEHVDARPAREPAAPEASPPGPP